MRQVLQERALCSHERVSIFTLWTGIRKVRDLAVVELRARDRVPSAAERSYDPLRFLRASRYHPSCGFAGPTGAAANHSTADLAHLLGAASEAADATVEVGVQLALDLGGRRSQEGGVMSSAEDLRGPGRIAEDAPVSELSSWLIAVRGQPRGSDRGQRARPRPEPLERRRPPRRSRGSSWRLWVVPRAASHPGLSRLDLLAGEGNGNREQRPPQARRCQLVVRTLRRCRRRRTSSDTSGGIALVRLGTVLSDEDSRCNDGYHRPRSHHQDQPRQDYRLRHHHPVPSDNYASDNYATNDRDPDDDCRHREHRHHPTHRSRSFDDDYANQDQEPQSLTGDRWGDVIVVVG